MLPGAWAGEPAFILGGGASLKGFEAARLKGMGRVFAVNDAGLDLAPWADVLYFADGEGRWFGWNRHRIHLFTGTFLVSRMPIARPPRPIVKVSHDPNIAVGRQWPVVAGACGGAQTLNLAYHMGCRPIHLLGFDMGGSHWHDNHKVQARDRYQSHFIPALERMAEELARDGVPVFNLNPNSALRAFPFGDIDSVLQDLA